MEELKYEDVINILSNMNKTDEKNVSIDFGRALTQQSNIFDYDYEKVLDLFGSKGVTQNTKMQNTAGIYQSGSSFLEDILKDAEKELQGTISEIGKNVITDIKDMNIGASKKNTLILVNLSTDDQINELEKISIGLDQKVFTEEQIKIIKEETNGLYNYIKTITKKGISIGGDGEIRNQRLEEVIKKLANI
ncbi:MAG: hypothetical protein ACP5M9_03685 [Candidatus Micrarchaeia archaeon]